jgi:threonine/homoserine/homoserine lactone efflux protein
MYIEEFLVAAVLLTLMPGPDILCVLVQSMTRGKKAGIVFAAGLCTGLVVHVTTVALGVSALLLSSSWAFTLLKILGACYLFYLGVKTFWHCRENHFQLSDTAPIRSRLYGKGILMNVLNPKVILFFLALFPRFVNPEMGHPMGQVFVLGAIFMATDYVTSPMTTRGQLLYGFGIGLITVVIRLWGSYPEGVSFAILLMNAATPLIDKYILPKRFVK